MSIPSVVLNAHRGIAAQAEHKEHAKELARLYVEWGYKACERGLNIQATMAEFEAIQGKQ